MSSLTRGELGADPVTILLVEPDASDAELLLDSFRSADITTSVHTVEAGDEALDFLSRLDAPEPNLVFLSGNLPGDVTAETVLRAVKESEELRQTPVIVMASDPDEEDVARAYTDYANAYVKKPVDSDEFLEVARSLREFWIAITHLPPVNKREADDSLDRS